jgi:saccharopine dehydrogenase (NAD+, L-lysine-forming)
MMVLTGQWGGAGVFNVEEFNPDPFLDKLGEMGLPWQEEIGIDLEL